MMIARLYDDADGHSHFGEVEIKQTGTAQRVNALSQDVSYWQLSVSQPGYTVDWQPTGETKTVPRSIGAPISRMNRKAPRPTAPAGALRSLFSIARRCDSAGR